MTDSRGTTVNEYDSRDRLVKTTNPDGSVISYTYDAKGNRTSVKTPSGTAFYVFDALNRLSKVTDPDGGITSYAYDNAGNRKLVIYPNGTRSEYFYDSLNRLTGLENRNSGGVIPATHIPSELPATAQKYQRVAAGL